MLDNNTIKGAMTIQLGAEYPDYPKFEEEASQDFRHIGQTVHGLYAIRKAETDKRIIKKQIQIWIFRL